jgi:ribosomal-protein-alanine N-acetyltransferase
LQAHGGAGDLRPPLESRRSRPHIMSENDHRSGGARGGSASFALRHMVLEDIDQVLEIERESFSEPWSRKNFEYELLQLDVSELIVAVVGKRVIGYTVTWFLGDEVHLANVAVRANRRERGVGRVLVEDVIARARRSRAHRVLLEVRESNFEARNLYDSLGFLPVGIRRDYYRKEKEDAVLMQCVLEYTGVADEDGGPGG